MLEELYNSIENLSARIKGNKSGSAGPPGVPANQDDQDPWDDSFHATNAIYQIHHGFTRFAELNSL